MAVISETPAFQPLVTIIGIVSGFFFAEDRGNDGPAFCAEVFLPFWRLIYLSVGYSMLGTDVRIPVETYVLTILVNPFQG